MRYFVAAAIVAAVFSTMAQADDIEFGGRGPIVKGKLTTETVAKLKAKADWKKQPLSFDKDATDEDLKTVDLLKDDLEHLSVADCKKLTDLSPIGACTKLKTLNVRAVPFKDLAFVGALKDLEELDTFMPPIQDTGTSALKDISAFASLTKLKKAHFYHCPFTTIAPLAGATGMEDLSLYMAKGVTDLAPLKGMKGLKRLDLYSSGATDLEPIAGCTELTYIWLYNTSFKDYGVLKGFTKMEDLGCGLSKFAQLDVIGSMPHLKKLGVWKCPIADWSPLKTAPKSLEEVILQDTSFTDASLLADLPKLKRVDIQGCKVKDLTPFVKLPALEALSLGGVDGITDLTFLKDAPKLKYVYFAKDQVSAEAIAKLKELKPKLSVQVSHGAYR